MNKKKYEEIGLLYRFFLSWRHAAFAGDIIIIYGVISLTFSIYKEYSDFAWLIPFIASPIGILLWIIDRRNRDLYHAATRAGKILEKSRGGFYTELAKEELPVEASPFKKFTHSAAIDILFWGTSILFLCGSIMLFLWVNLKTLSGN